MKEQLMIPRYEVIADYPNSPYKAGDIITLSDFDSGVWYKKYPPRHFEQSDSDKYPAIFKPLKWYERRELSEMPEYVKYIGVTVITKVDKHYVMGIGFNNQYGKWTEYDHVMPSTLEEYNAYISEQTKKTT